MGRGRRIAVQLLALLALLAVNFLIVFVFTDALGRVGDTPSLEPPGSQQAQIGADHPGEAVHLAGAAAAVVLSVTGIAGLIVRPQQAGSALHVGLGGLAWLVAAGVVGNPDNYGGQAGPIDLAFVVLAMPSLLAAFVAAPWRSWRSGGRARPGFLVLAAAGAPWFLYGVQQALMQRYTWPPMADPHHQAHWFAMSLVALHIVLACAGAAATGTGWRIAAVASGTAGIAIAVASLYAPESGSALNATWASAAMLWGFALLALTWHASRATGRDRASASAHRGRR